MIARVLALAGRDLIARLGGPLGDAARAAEVPRDRASRAAELAVAAAPVPAGIRGVHASWLEAALAPLPERARTAVAAGGGEPPDVWLARWACAELPPLPPLRDVQAPRSIEDVVAMRELERWLVALGGAHLAYAALLARPDAPRRADLGPSRAVIARCRGGDPLAIGARAIAPYCDPFTARQLAVRLPRDRGLAVLAELDAHRGDPIAHAAQLWPVIPSTREGGPRHRG